MGTRNHTPPGAPARVLKTIVRGVKRLTPIHWAYLHFKLAIGVAWPATLWAVTPTVLHDALKMQMVGLMCLTTLLGALLSIVGLVMTAQRGRVRTIGVSVELAGIALLSSGPLAYFLSQTTLAFSGNGHERAALAVFSYAMLAAIVCRLIMLIPWFIREGRDERKEV